MYLGFELFELDWMQERLLGIFKQLYEMVMVIEVACAVLSL